MKASRNALHDRRNSVVGILVILIALGMSIVGCRRSIENPKLLNESTKAREVRPLTAEPDPRFAPLPLEREKHGK
jgi:hypothetical protein